jgi:hypothetical protein
LGLEGAGFIGGGIENCSVEEAVGRHRDRRAGGF